jgi:hydrogenase large subunit
LDSSEFIKVKSILSTIKGFIQNKMIPDAFVIGEYYPEYYSMGAGWGNFLSYGVFDYPYKDIYYIEPSIYVYGMLGKPDLSLITESI